MCQGIGHTSNFTNGEIHDLDIKHYENQWKDALRVTLMQDKIGMLECIVEYIFVNACIHDI
jgi:hypothetical protein